MPRTTASVVAFWRPRGAILEPLAIFAATRLALGLTVWAGQVLLPLRPAPGSWHAFPRHLWLDGWVRWESGWHLLVAQQGYALEPSAGSPAPIVLPLYPLLVRLAGALLGHPALGALVVANLASLVALVLLYTLIASRFDADLAARTTLLVSLFPLAYLFQAAYPDALVLLLAVACFALLERGRLLAAAAAAALAGLTAPSGLVLWPCLLAWRIARGGRRGALDLLGLALPPLALAAFAVYLSRAVGGSTGSALAALVGPAGQGILAGRAPYAGLLAGAPDPWLAGSLALAAVALATVPSSARLLGAPYATLSLGLVALPLVVGPESAARYLALAFPAALVLARRCRGQLAQSAVLAASSLLLGILALLFAGWYPAGPASVLGAPGRDALASTGAGDRASIPTTARPLSLELANDLAVLGYELTDDRVEPGQAIPIVVYLRTLRPTTARHALSVHVDDQAGQTRASADHLLGNSSWAAGFTAGDVTRATVVVPIGKDVPTGVYRPELFLFQHPTFERLPLVDPRSFEERRAVLGEIVVLRPGDVLKPGEVRPQREAGAILGGQIRLRGFDLPSAPIQPAADLAVGLYWEAIAPPSANYTVFVQLLDEQGKLVAQSDAYPVGGRLPTTKWRAGEIVRDVHRIKGPEALSGKAATVIVGMYRLETMERLPVVDLIAGRVGGVDGQGQSTGDYFTLGQVPMAGR